MVERLFRETRAFGQKEPRFCPRFLPIERFQQLYRLI
jgi:hypothetical protein